MKEALVGLAAIFGVFFFGFVTGGKMMYDHKEQQIAEARADQGRKDYAKLVSAMDQAAGLRERLDSARSEYDRVRKSYEDRLRRAKATAGSADKGADAGCERLLRESVDLLQEARSALVRNAGAHDALAKAIAP